MTGSIGARWWSISLADVIVHYNCTQVGLFPPGVLARPSRLLANMPRSPTTIMNRSMPKSSTILVENGNAARALAHFWRHRGTGGRLHRRHGAFPAMAGTPSPRCTNFWIIRVRRAIGCEKLRELRGNAARRARRDWSARKSSDASDELANFAPSQGPDIGLIRKLYSPDIVCEFVGDRARIPYAGRHVGVEA